MFSISNQSLRYCQVIFTYIQAGSMACKVHACRVQGPWPDDNYVKGPLSQVFMFAYVSDILLNPVFNLAPSKWPGVHGLPILYISPPSPPLPPSPSLGSSGLTFTSQILCLDIRNIRNSLTDWAVQPYPSFCT